MRPLASVVVLVLLTACMRSHATEHIAPVPGDKFKTIATIAGGSSRNNLRMSSMVRQLLRDSGIAVVRRAGRWDDEKEAVTSICKEGDVNGVLFIWYDRLELNDCESGKLAYTIDGTTSGGLPDLVNRLVRYLHGLSAPTEMTEINMKT
jgi:hypothetical protein